MRYDRVDFFTPDKREKVAEDVRRGDVIFTIRGSHEYMYDDIPAIHIKDNRTELSPNACAKKEGSRYFIKINNRGDIFNPLDPTHINTNGKTENSLPVWKYHRIAYTSFAHYAHFLKTRNTAYINLCRRELGNSV